MSIRLPADSPAPAPTTLKPTTLKPSTTARPAGPPPAPSSTLRGRGLKISGSGTPPTDVDATGADPIVAKPSSGLVGKLVDKLTGRPRR